MIAIEKNKNEENKFKVRIKMKEIPRLEETKIEKKNYTSGKKKSEANKVV